MIEIILQPDAFGGMCLGFNNDIPPLEEKRILKALDTTGAVFVIQSWQALESE